MGREIRRVPPNWDHPKKEVLDFRTRTMVEQYQPMFDKPFGPAMREWEESKNLPFWEWHGSPPRPEFYRPDWPEESQTWFQVYETVSEGTPVSPPFATEDELIQYLADNGDFEDQSRVKEGRQAGPAAWGREAAERFVRKRWAPSRMLVNGQLLTARDGA